MILKNYFLFLIDEIITHNAPKFANPIEQRMHRSISIISDSAIEASPRTSAMPKAKILNIFQLIYEITSFII